MEKVADPKGLKVSEGNWLTAGGYVVQLDSGRWATLETSPGTYRGKTASENKVRGWYYTQKGEVTDLDDDWSDKLRIVEKLPCGLPKLPSDYRYAGGYPQFRQPLTGERFLSVDEDGRLDGGVCSSGSMTTVFNGRRLIVEKIAVPELPPPREQEMIPFFGASWKSRPLDAMWDEETKVWKKIEAKKVPNLASRVASYFVVEPAKGIYRVAKESMGYIVFLGLLSVAGYSCYNPSGVAAFVKSCVPSISVSFEKPEILK